MPVVTMPSASSPYKMQSVQLISDENADFVNILDHSLNNTKLQLDIPTVKASSKPGISANSLNFLISKQRSFQLSTHELGLSCSGTANLQLSSSNLVDTPMGEKNCINLAQCTDSTETQLVSETNNTSQHSSSTQENITPNIKIIDNEKNIEKAEEVTSKNINTSSTIQKNSEHIKLELCQDNHCTSRTRRPKVKKSLHRVSDFIYRKKARLLQQFSINQLDMNKIPSWPPIKRNKVCQSDWDMIHCPRSEPRPESKSNRLFLNSLASMYDGVVTSRSTLGRRAGFGLFCTRKGGFERSQIFTEFVGWLVHRDVAEKLRKERRASHIIAVEKGFLYIDGEKFPHFGIGGGSFANDGSEFLGGPGNNAEFHHWYDDQMGRKRVFLRATRNITEGEEIFVPYDRQYWEDNFEEEIDNCPDAFVETKLRQMWKKNKHLKTSRTVEDEKARLKEFNDCRKSQKANVSEKKKPAIKPPKKPKRPPMSAFIIFSTEKRHEIVEKNPTVCTSLADASRLLGEEWHKLDTESKQIYFDVAMKNRHEYKKKMLDYEKAIGIKKRKRRKRKVKKCIETQRKPSNTKSDRSETGKES